MSWLDLGLVFPVDRLCDWAQSHAYVPTALDLGDRIRVFVAFWDGGGIGRLGFIDVDAAEPRRVLGHSRTPLLEDAERGAFDSDGVTPLAVAADDGEIRLYYAGWRRLEQSHARYTLFTGLALSRDGERFTRYARQPVIGPNAPDCTVRTGGAVTRDGSRWRCWYAEYVDQIVIDGKPTPSYQLATMDSPDGISWPLEAQPVFRVRPGEIFGYGRSAVWKADGRYHGLFSVRRVDGGYRAIEYAASDDGYRWSEPGLADMAFAAGDTQDGQDQVCFPSLVFRPDRILMFYNGNDLGRAGLRAAVWRSRPGGA